LLKARKVTWAVCFLVEGECRSRAFPLFDILDLLSKDGVARRRLQVPLFRCVGNCAFRRLSFASRLASKEIDIEQHGHPPSERNLIAKPAAQQVSIVGLTSSK
jgi:hypothetical protein